MHSKTSIQVNSCSKTLSRGVYTLVARTWKRYVPSPAPLTDVKANTFGLVHAAQSCRGTTALLLLMAVVDPPVPDSLHWKPAVAGSELVAKLKEGLRLLDSTGGAAEMWATGKLQVVEVLPLQPGL